MINRRFLLLCLGALAAAVVYLIWTGLGDNLVYYLTPSEAVERPREDGERFRLGGLVETGSVVQQENGAVFTVGDGAASVTVVHTGAPPQLFREGVGVVVEGAWRGAEFHSDLLLVNHDEQYRAPDGDGPYQVPDGGT